MLSPFASSVRPLYQGFLGRDQSNYLVFEPISPLALRLPTELTCEIFLYCLPDDEFNVPKSTTAPLLVCHIFKRWRNIALATPGLWSSLNLNLKWFRKSYWDTEMDGVRFFSSWIRNARNAPLSIRLSPPPPDGAHDTESPRRTPDPVCQSDVRAVLAMIRERAAQWQNISLWLSWEYEYVRDTLPAEGSVPRLGKFAIEGVHVLYFSRFSNLLARLGALRELHLDDLQAPSLLMAPQWTQLTAFDVRSIQFSHCIDVLHFAPNLLHCTFYIIHNAPQHRDVRSVTSNLQALTLSENRPHDKPLPIALLQRLTLPSLKRLQLHFLEDRLMYPGRRIIPGFAPIAPRFSQQLHELSLHYMPVEEETLVECLASVPSVVNLTVHPVRYFCIGTLFSHLRSRPDILPNLASLHAHIRHDHEWTRNPLQASAVVDMLSVRARRPDGGAGLQSFRLKYHDSFHFMGEEVRGDPRARRLMDEGMQIYIGNP